MNSNNSHFSVRLLVETSNLVDRWSPGCWAGLAQVELPLNMGSEELLRNDDRMIKNNSMGAVMM